MFCIRRLAGARHVSPAVLWTLWPEGGSEPLTSAPRSLFMTQSLVLSINVWRGLGIWPLRIKHWLSFSQADLGPTSAQELFFSDFVEKFGIFFWRFVLIASGTEILWRVSFEFKQATSRFHCHRSQNMFIFYLFSIGLSCWIVGYMNYVGRGIKFLIINYCLDLVVAWINLLVVYRRRCWFCTWNQVITMPTRDFDTLPHKSPNVHAVFERWTLKFCKRVQCAPAEPSTKGFFFSFFAGNAGSVETPKYLAIYSISLVKDSSGAH